MRQLMAGKGGVCKRGKAPRVPPALQLVRAAVEARLPGGTLPSGPHVGDRGCYRFTSGVNG